MKQKTTSSDRVEPPKGRAEEVSATKSHAQKSDLVSILGDIGCLPELDSEVIARLSSELDEADVWANRVIDSYNIRSYFEHSAFQLGTKDKSGIETLLNNDTLDAAQQEEIRNVIAQWHRARLSLLEALVRAGKEHIADTLTILRRAVETKTNQHKIREETI